MGGILRQITGCLFKACVGHICYNCRILICEMSFTIEIVDIYEPTVDLCLRQLIRYANNAEFLLPAMFLAANLNSKASKPSFFLAAIAEGEIIGCNGFLANDFYLNGQAYIGYQSCWSATHPRHQGKKVFSSIIQEAKRLLKEQGAGFLYGIANDTSHPIFTKKLGFTEMDSWVLRIMNFPFSRKPAINNAISLPTEGVCRIDEQQVLEHKRLQYPGEVKQVSYNNSWLWGKLLHKKKFGTRWPVFYVGGVQLQSGKDLEGLIEKLFEQHHPLFVQFFSCAGNTFNPLLKGWKHSKMNGFIFYELNMPVPDHRNLMIGVLDIF